MMVARIPKPTNGAIHPGSWGMLAVGRSFARFLWFQDPRELLAAVLEIVAPAGGNTPARWRKLAGGDGLEDEEERLHAFLMLEGLIKEINRREWEYDFRVNWWGPLTDLQESLAPVPAMIRAWFRRSRGSSESLEEPEDGSIPGEHLQSFVRFLDRVSFRIDELGEA